MLLNPNLELVDFRFSIFELFNIECHLMLIWVWDLQLIDIKYQIKISPQEPVNVWSKEDLRDAANKDFGETEDKVHSGNHCLSMISFIFVWSFKMFIMLVSFHQIRFACILYSRTLDGIELGQPERVDCSEPSPEEY